MPQALIASIQESRAAVEDVANPGLPQDIIDPDTSGKAVNAMQHRLDMQSYVYQDNHKTAMRRDGEIYASMARDVYDTKRDVVLTAIDGTSKKATVNEPVFDPETFNMQTRNEMKTMVFDVYADIGPQFESVKAQNREELKELTNALPPGTPAHTMMLNEYLTMVDGVAFKDIRDYARKQLIIMGVKKPETQEEQQMLMQAQQAQSQKQPDPAMMLAAQAEMEKAKAQQMEQQNKQAQIQLDAVKVKQAGDKNNTHFVDTQSIIEERRATTLKTMAETEKLTNESLAQQMDNVIKLRGSAT
jgi:hypothetical protein